jgi:hypothetical protein
MPALLTYAQEGGRPVNDQQATAEIHPDDDPTACNSIEGHQDAELRDPAQGYWYCANCGSDWFDDEESAEGEP